MPGDRWKQEGQPRPSGLILQSHRANSSARRSATKRKHHLKVCFAKQKGALFLLRILEAEQFLQLRKTEVFPGWLWPFKNARFPLQGAGTVRLWWAGQLQSSESLIAAKHLGRRACVWLYDPEGNLPSIPQAQGLAVKPCLPLPLQAQKAGLAQQGLLHFRLWEGRRGGGEGAQHRRPAPCFPGNVPSHPTRSQLNQLNGQIPHSGECAILPASCMGVDYMTSRYIPTPIFYEATIQAWGQEPERSLLFSRCHPRP